MEKSTGKIKFFNFQKGFGFITSDSGGKELFIHASSFDGDTQSLTEGQKVTYTVEEGRKGPEAKNVQLG